MIIILVKKKNDNKFYVDGDKFQLFKINVSFKHETVKGHKQNDSNI